MGHPHPKPLESMSITTRPPPSMVIFILLSNTICPFDSFIDIGLNFGCLGRFRVFKVFWAFWFSQSLLSLILLLSCKFFCFIFLFLHFLGSLPNETKLINPIWISVCYICMGWYTVLVWLDRLLILEALNKLYGLCSQQILWTLAKYIRSWMCLYGLEYWV